MKLLISTALILFVTTSAQASDIKVYDKAEKVEKGLQGHSIELSRALHKRGKSKKWGRAKEGAGKPEATQQIMSGHRKKKSPKEERTKF